MTIEVERIFSLIAKFINLKRCYLQIRQFFLNDFCKKNWSNDLRIDYKPPSNLVKMIEKKLYFEEELKSFEVFF